MLAGKNLVITGVSSGIGRRTAELALAMRANVFGVDRVPPPAPMGHFVQGELGCQNGINEVVNQLPQKVDGLLAIAGLSGTGGAELTMKVNFYGLRYLAEQLAPKIREGGSITSVASFAGFGWRENLERTKSLLAIKGFPDAAELARLDCVNENSYPVSKEVLIMWTMKAAHQPLFRERGIRVNSVSPGPVETPILTQFRQVLGNERVDYDVVRGGRSGTPDDIAPVLLFLASDASRWINGTNVQCDGGLDAAHSAEVMGF